ncbi:MAG: DUF4368 domain-containing protein [Synergistaceae bacterium]|nr:DUF4368 domain-containing protein [Synergistaceae bacterium]
MGWDISCVYFNMRLSKYQKSNSLLVQIVEIAGGKCYNLFANLFCPSLTDAYETEQAELRAQSAELQVLLDEYEHDGHNAERFLVLAKKYPTFDELTPQMLHEFVDKVFIHEGDKSSGERRQQIDIHLNFIGQFKVPQEISELTPEELAAAEKKLERKLARRAYHKQWRDKKKAERAAAKTEAETTVVADDSTTKPAA